MSTTEHDLKLCIQHLEHKRRDMGLGICFSRMLYSMDNLSLQRILAYSLRMGYRKILVDIGMSQRRFGHDIQPLPHKDLEYRVSNFQQDNQL